MFSPKNLMNEYHKLQQHEEELQRQSRDTPRPPPVRSESPSFNPLQLLAYLSQIDWTHPPAVLKSPVAIVAILVLVWLVIGLLTKLLFVAIVAAVAYVLIKGVGSTGGSGPQEDVAGRRPHLAQRPSDPPSSSPYPSPNGGASSNPQPSQPKDLASFLWQKGVPAAMEIGQTFLNKAKRDAATREVRKDD
ncbi:uncharacterized protein JCM15063_001601 [Sporobolomyces koalae]|uniref:uncharacterized protein n=1 Tax=Sporobolomyces koalae TaxID=500713 RepID=UPI00317873EE